MKIFNIIYKNSVSVFDPDIWILSILGGISRMLGSIVLLASIWFSKEWVVESVDGL